MRLSKRRRVNRYPLDPRFLFQRELIWGYLVRLIINSALCTRKQHPQKLNLIKDQERSGIVMKRKGRKVCINYCKIQIP